MDSNKFEKTKEKIVIIQKNTEIDKVYVDKRYIEYQNIIIEEINKVIDFQEFEKELAKNSSHKNNKKLSNQQLQKLFLQNCKELIKNSPEINAKKEEYKAILNEIESKKIAYYSHEINGTFCVSLQCRELRSQINIFPKNYVISKIEKICFKYNPVNCFINQTIQKISNTFQKTPKIQNNPKKSLES